MDIPQSNQPDLTRFTEFDIISVDHEWDLNGRVQNGWKLIATWVERPAAGNDGSFTDELKALWGREK